MSNYDPNWEQRLSQRPLTRSGFSQTLMRRIENRARAHRPQRSKVRWTSFAAALLMISMIGFTVRLATQSVVGTSGSSAAIPHLAIQRFDMINDKDGWAVVNQGTQVVRTTDGGANWKDVSPVRTSPINTFSMTQFADSETAWVVLSNSLTRQDVNIPLQVFFTSDGGAHWRSSTLPMAGSEQPYPLGIQFMDGGNGWLLVGHVTGMPLHEQSAVFRTNDGGNHWTHVSETTRRDNLQKVYDNGLPEMANPSGVIFQTSDEGWMTVAGPVSNSPVYQTKDGGQTWFPSAIPAGISLAANGVVQRGSEYAYNGGFPLHFFNASDGVIGLNYYSPTKGYVNVLYSTHDGGLRWTPSAGVPLSFSQRSNNTSCGWFDELSATDNWLLTGYSLSHTTDGQHWTTTRLQQALVTVDFVNNHVGWALSSAGQLLKTTDGGQHWQEMHAVMLGGH